MWVRMVAGQRPFPGTSLAEIHAAMHEPPKLAAMPAPLRDLAEALRQRDPERRPPNGAAVLAALDNAYPQTLPDDHRELVAAVWGQHRHHSRPSTLSPEISDVSKTWGSLSTPAPTARTNLPPPRDEFIGRRQELEAVEQQLLPVERGGQGLRLMTMTGTGGTGKTRLAVQLGRRTLDIWPGGVWLCDLTDARNESDILAVMGRVLEVPLGRSPQAQLTEAIRGRGEVLLILDNFEQIVDIAPQTVGRWIDQAPQVSVLVTSRQPLRLRGERIYAVEPFDEADAAALFEERARTLDNRFQLTKTDAPILANLLT